MPSGSDSRGSKKFLDLSSRAKNDGSLISAQFAQPAENRGPAIVRILPDPQQEIGRQFFFTASGHVRTSALTKLDSAPNYPADTGDAGQVQKNDGVARGQTFLERTAVISIQNPLVPG